MSVAGQQGELAPKWKQQKLPLSGKSGLSVKAQATSPTAWDTSWPDTCLCHSLLARCPWPRTDSL